MKIVREHLNEELIGKYRANYGSGNVEIYKNPKSIKRMGPWARALHDQDGNFYIASVENETQETIATTHTDMVKWLNTNGENVKLEWNQVTGGYENGIGWQRHKNTNNFYLSESYEKNMEMHIDYVVKFMNEVGIWAPTDAKFHVEHIYDIEDWWSAEKNKYK